MSEQSQTTIRLLPPLVVNKIAAGEVVERPASVIKELLENAVDSGATRIDVAIEKGGAQLVRVVDNGRGIGAEELPLAVTNHATSKISSAEELFEVGTLGFRGEALASIASVSRLTLRSRPAESDGAELIVNGGHAEEITPAGCPLGTTVEVRDLFYNTPVRQKFLRTPQTEAGHATEAFTRVALAHPAVHFTLSHNGRTLHDLPACRDAELSDWRERIASLFGDELADALIEVKSHDQREDGSEIALEGFVAAPTQSRTHTRLQYLLVNGRSIRDRSLQHALGEAYRGLLLTGRRPICFLKLTMPPGLVDVNVHPQKQEVRFSESGPLYSQLLGTLRSKFLATDLRAGVAEATTEDETVSAASDTPSELESWARGGLTQRRLDTASETAKAPHSRGADDFRPFPSLGGGHEPLTLHRIVRDSPASPLSSPPSGTPTTRRASLPDSHAEPSSTESSPEPNTPAAPATTTKALQLHNRYLVVETEAGLEVIDQHALHERVLYEQLRNRVLAGPLEKQKLLVPEPVDLTPAEAAAVLEHAELLGSIGLEVQPFGGDTVLVASFPALLRKLAPADTLREVAAQLLAEGKEPEARDLCDELLHTMSCKAAVKYGDPLTDEEVSALLAARQATENHHHCPHGRPTSLIFTREDLDKRFQRI